MRPLIHEIRSEHSPESLVEQLGSEPGLALFRSLPPHSPHDVPGRLDSPQPRYSLVLARPFLILRSFGSRCELEAGEGLPDAGREATECAGRGLKAKPTAKRAPLRVQFGNPWHLLDQLMSRFELLDEWDFPFPLGGCFGYWGYDLKNFVEPKLPRRAADNLELPDSHLGFYDSLVVFDHAIGKTWVISTGLTAGASRCEQRARAQFDFWRARLAARFAMRDARCELKEPEPPQPALASSPPDPASRIASNLSRDEFIAKVKRAQEYIRRGDIYQVNLSQRLAASCRGSGWELYKRLNEVSPAPFSAFLDCGDFQIASSSPELFLGLTGRQAQTRPIKGTRPRSADPTRDAQLTYELQTSAKEMAELVMITDLLRNDFGRVCEFGSVQTPELVRLERFPQVQHLVSTVEGRLRPQITHSRALASCFPGGSVTGAPKFRAMELIDELEPVTRGPYTGALGYLGFNQQSQLSIVIRSAICKNHRAFFQVGAGIVADSDPAAEYDETIAKARGFLEALKLRRPEGFCSDPRISQMEPNPKIRANSRQ